MALLTNPMEIEEFLKGAEVADYSAPSPSTPGGSMNSYQTPTADESGSILDTIGERIKLRAEGFLASQVTDPEVSNYARNQYAKQYKEWENEYNKLGTVGQVVSEFGAAGPAIAAFASTPWTKQAGIAAGMAMSGMDAYSDTLQAQYEEGQDWDTQAAKNVALATAGTDLLLGGAGSKIGSAVARKVATPGAVGMSKAMGAVAPVAAETLVADAGSAAASRIYENLASGRDWDDNVGGAAFTGAGAGLGLRGAAKSFEGLSKNLNIPYNRGGEDAVARAASINRKNGTEANPEFMNSFVDAENAAKGIRDQLDEMDINDPNLSTKFKEYNTLSDAKASDAAIADLAEMLPDLHMNTKGFDFVVKDSNGNERNVGRDILNMTQETMDAAKVNTSRTKEGWFQTKESAAKEGLTQEAFDAKMADSYNKVLSKGRGNLLDNIEVIETAIGNARGKGSPDVVINELTDLLKLAKEINTVTNGAFKSPTRTAEVQNRIKYLGNQFRELSIRNGLESELTGFSGRKGDYDPLRDFIVEKGLWDSAHAQTPSFSHRTADPLKDTKGDTSGSWAPWAIAKKTVTGVPSAIAAQYRRGKAKASIQEAQKLGATLRRPSPSKIMEEELARSNGPAAAQAAADDLNAQGINTPPPSSAEVPPVSPDVVETPVPQSATKAPVEPVEEVVIKSRPEAKTHPTPRPKAVEEPVVEVAPKPEAKAAPAPKESPKSKREKARAKREAERAVEARIEAATQERMKAGEKAKAAKAPTQKPAPVQEPVVEAPVKAEEITPVVESVVETPKPKAEAKAAKAPKQKDQPEQVVEEKVPAVPKGKKKPTRRQTEEPVKEEVIEIPEPEVEALAPKPEAKAAPSPKESAKAKREKARAEKTAARQAKQALIAAELQEQLKAKAKAAKAPKQKDQPEQVDEVIPEVIEAVETPKPKAEAKAAKAPKQKEAPVVEEVAQEAPQKAPTEPLGRKQPTRTKEEAEAPESVTEAPVEEPSKTKVDAKTIIAPTREIAEEKWSVKRRNEDKEGFLRHMKAREELKIFNQLISGDVNRTKDELANVINDMGGISKFLAAAEEAGKTPATYLKDRVREKEALAKQEAANKMKEMEALAAQVKSKETLAREAEEARIQEESQRSAEEEMDRAIAAKEKEFFEEMDARGYDEEVQGPVREMIKNGTSLKNARIHAARLHREKGERIREEIKDNKRIAAEAQEVLKLKGQKDQVNQYLADTGSEEIPGVQERINKAFSNVQGPLSASQMKNLMDGIQKHIEAEEKRYADALARVDKADPRAAEYEAAGMIRTNAKKVLSDNRQAVDARLAKAEAESKEATKARQVLESDYDRLFREADTRDANIDKVIRQKEELREDLLKRNIPESQVDEILNRTFLKRESSPLSAKEMQKVILSTVDAISRDRATTLENKVRAVKEVVKSTDDDVLKEMALKATTEASVNTSREEFEQITAMARAMEGEMRERGMKKESTRLEAFNKAIIEGLENKIKYPDNPELWVPANYLKAIQSTFGEGTGSHAGGMWTTIKMIVTGDTEGLPKFGTKEAGEMKNLQNKHDKLEMGKLLTGIEGIVAK